jgi:hypothetical protein
VKEVKPAWIAVAVVAVIAAFFLLLRMSKRVSPIPVALWVAVQPEDENLARVGPVQVPVGTRFRLHAVMEAETLRGGRIYYTEAEALELRGEPVASESLRPWTGSLDARILWFTIEGSTPYREVSPDEELEGPRFQGIFRPDWGQAWSVFGDLRPASENFLPDDEQTRRTRRFGIQRFQVRIELFGRGSDLVPERRLASWGAEELPDRIAEFPAVASVLRGALEAPSRVFGLPQIEFANSDRSVADRLKLAAWARDLVGFSRISILREWLATQGMAWEDLSWEAVELGVAGVEARPGDLLRVGTRIVWILEDRGESGLDYDDWCLDFERGARVRRLGDVFVGQGLVDWARALREKA